MRIQIHESVCAGDLGDEVPTSLQREGRAMLAAIAADFCLLPEVEVTTENKAADFTLVIAPEFDDLLLDRSQAVLEAGGRLLGSLPSAIRLTGDKFALAIFWYER